MKENIEISKWCEKNYIDLVVFILFVLVMVQPIFDPDMWWHLRLGREMVEGGKIIFNDTFSFSLPNYEFVNHSWLLDILTFYLYEIFGLLGVNLVYGGFTVAGFWFIYLLLKKVIKKKELALLFPLFAIYITEFISLRAHSFSFFGISFLWYFLTSLGEENKESNKRIWLLPVLFLTWANMHGGFILGLLVWGLWILFGIVGKIVSVKRLNMSGDGKKQILFLFLSALITFINPYGTGVWKFAFDLFRNNASSVFNSDWVPLLSSRLGTESSMMRWAILIFGLIALLSGKKYLRKKLVAFIFGIMTLYSIRYALVFLILITPLLFLWLEEMISKFGKKISWKILAAVSVLVVFVVMFNNVAKMICAYGSNECYGKMGNFPYESVKYFQENNLQGNIFNFYTWGGYLEWQLPDNKYFIDGRMDSFYVGDESFLSEFAMIVELKDGWRETFEKYDVDYVLLPKEMKIVDELEKMGWKKVFEGNVEVILVK